MIIEKRPNPLGRIASHADSEQDLVSCRSLGSGWMNYEIREKKLTARVLRAVALLVVAVIVLECSNRESGGPAVIPVHPDDPEMLAAMMQARDTFPEFRRAVEEDWKRVIPLMQSSMVKAYFFHPETPTEGEHMWVAYERFENNLIVGTLTSEPRLVRHVSKGDSVSFPLSRLSDWLYVEDDKAHGVFTVQLLRSRMTEEERRAHDSAYLFLFANE